MRSVYEERLAEATKTQRQLRQGTDTIVRGSKFKGMCQLAYGSFKTAEMVAADCKRDVRVVARWLSGEHEPPVSVALRVMAKIFER